MLLKAVMNSSQQKSHIAPPCSSLFVIFVCLFLFTILTTSVKATSTYTEEWIDDSNPNAGYVVGCGVTRTEYYEDYHLISVSTTITSPNGRSTTDSAIDSGAYYKHPYVARVEAVLAWDWNDVNGNYVVTSDHYSECPLEDLGSTSISLPIVLHAYRREEPSGEYVPTCDSSCTYYPRYIPIGVTAPYIQCGSVKNPLIGCGTGLCRDLTVPGTCRG